MPPLKYDAGRAGDHHERHVLGGPDAEERLGGEHERPHVEALLALLVGHPALVDLDQRLDGLDEVVDVERGSASRWLERTIRAAFSSGRNAQIEPSSCR